MADTFSTLLNLRYQQTGGNTNTWGDLLNTDVFAVLELGIAGKSTHAVTGGALDLSATPLQEQVHIFTGILTSNETVTIPNLSKRMLVINNTTGAYVLLMKTSSGTAVEIPQGCRVDVYCDGANILYRHDRKEVGQISYFGGTSVPSGWMECDGTSLVRADHPDLFTAISTTWGTVDGTHFTLPDFKTAGRFLRSRTGSVTAGTLQAADIAAHGHLASGTFSGTTGTESADHTHAGTTSTETQAFTHSYNTAAGKNGSATGFFAGGGSLWYGADTGTTTGSQSVNHDHAFTTGGKSATHTHTVSGTCTITVANSTGTETRPINASALCCIKL